MSSRPPGTDSTHASKQDALPNIWEALTQDGRFTILLRLLEAAGLAPIFQSKQPSTLFAPTNEAFHRLPGSVLDALQNAQPDMLPSLLGFHIAQGALTGSELRKLITRTSVGPGLDAARVLTRLDKRITVVLSGEKPVKVGNAQIAEASLSAANGIIYVIDGVLFGVAPPGVEIPDVAYPQIVQKPFPAGAPLRIGDAELLYHSDIMKDAVLALSQVLAAKKAKINVARTIHLALAGVSNYAAPREPGYTDGTVIGAIVIQGSVTELPQAGAYVAQYQRASEVEFLDQAGRVVVALPATVIEAVPAQYDSAAILYSPTCWCFSSGPQRICVDTHR
jgi:uncharacterized surface protein with fasciclin (FAS1) repeats